LKVELSTFNFQPSTFNLQPSTFNLQLSTFNLQLSTFNFQPSTFPLKILHFSRDYTPHDHRFLAKMVQTGHEIFYLRLENAGHPYEDRPVPEGVTLIPWAGGQTRITRGDGPRLLSSLKQVIRRYRPDIIQAGPVQRAAFLTALAGYKNLITMSWGYDLLMDVHNGKAWQWATRYTLQRSAAFVGDCNTIRHLAIGHGMNPEKIVTFPWGADIQKFKPANQQISNQQTNQPANQCSPLRERRGWGDDCFVLLSTRNWSELYGVEDLARAFVHAARQRPELRLFMLSGGPLSGKIKSLIQSEVPFRNAGLLDRVHFPGQVNQDNLPAYYRAADLYISTSHSDGTSISLLEALASGVPVLLSDIPGNREWIPSPSSLTLLPPGEGNPPSPAGRGAGGEGAGWLFRDGDPTDLERAILHALDHRAHLPAMSRAARQLAEERGDWDKNFPHLLTAWEMVRG
jgi:glycosyltransferase involved in cell wall biosynthesis